MAKRSLIITSNEAVTGKKLMKSITDINPNATSDTMKQFARKLNNLTTNTYIQADCIDKFTVDTETATEPKQTPTFKFAAGSEPPWTLQVNKSVYRSYETNSDGVMSIAVNGQSDVAVGVRDGGDLRVITGQHASGSGTITIRITETDNFEAYQKTFDYTVE